MSFPERAGPRSTSAAPGSEWVLATPPSSDLVKELEAGLGLPRPLCSLLAVRGYDRVKVAKRFLRPLIDDLHPSAALADMNRLTARLARAIRSGEKILVHGDYDADGVCAAALMTRWIRYLGGKVAPFVPHRMQDGYDFGPKGLEVALGEGATVVVTVDCGIVAHDAVSRANQAGLDVLITDHHAPGASLPEAYAVVNPNRADCDYPNKGLAGAGVAYKVCEALATEFGEPLESLHPLLDLVALATVADMVPVTSENRALVRYGIRALEAGANQGLRALVQVTGLAGRSIDDSALGWILGPRINAVGRMSDADLALQLLLTDQETEADGLARRLEEANQRRKTEEQRTLDEAFGLLEERYVPDRDYGVVLAGEGWHPGVIGIVASRIAERIHRPTLLISIGEDGCRGSGRSIPDFDLHGALVACSEHLSRFGGHHQAAGLDLDRERLDAFSEAFSEVARERLHGAALRPVRSIDLELSVAEIDADLVRYLRYLGPFGVSNPQPIFIARSLGVASSPRVVGSGHLKVDFLQNGDRLPAIGFGMAHRFRPQDLEGSEIDALFHLTENEFRGVRSVQARLIDLRVSEAS